MHSRVRRRLVDDERHAELDRFDRLVDGDGRHRRRHQRRDGRHRSDGRNRNDDRRRHDGGGTTGGGTTTSGDFVWTAEPSGHSDAIAAVWGSGPSDVWAVGGHAILHSTGDGAWTTVHEDANASYQSVIGADGWIFVGGSACTNGVCQGGLLLRSSDAGATWSTVTLDYAVTGLSAAGGNVYADDGNVYASADHFDTMTAVPLDWPTSMGVFADGGTLVAYGGLRNAELRRSSDGGATWASVYSAAYGSQDSASNAVVRGGASLFALANGCSVPSCGGAVLRSSDGGATWAEASRLDNTRTGLWAANDAEVWVGGTPFSRSTDGGVTFTTVTLPHDTADPRAVGRQRQRALRHGSRRHDLSRQALRRRRRRWRWPSRPLAISH